jgi:multisubunit Na+/H+ antiporter MnhF subunit
MSNAGSSVAAHPLATPHLPSFVTAPGGSDGLMVSVAIFLLVAVIGIGILFLTIHSLPERVAHKGEKIQFEIVAILCLLSLFTHTHVFWVAALVLAFIELPNFGGPLRRIARSTEKLAGIEPLPEDIAHGKGHAAEHASHEPAEAEAKSLSEPAPKLAEASAPSSAPLSAPAALKGE